MNEYQARQGWQRPRAHRLALEARIVFDATLAVANPDVSSEAHPAATAEAVEKTVDAVPAKVSLTETPGIERNVEAKHQVFLIDASLENLNQLVEAHQGDEVFVLDAQQDGVAQIAAILDGRRDLDAIHLLCHGSAGELYLGNTVLDLAAVNGSHAEALSAIGATLADDGDLLIYGCDVGAGAVGQRFVSALAIATGADIAASSDATGAAARGGDWVLETSSGAIETESLALSAFDGLLAAPTISAPAVQMTSEDTNYTVNTPKITIDYADNSTPLTVQLSLPAGTGKLYVDQNGSSGASVSQNISSAVTIVGTKSQINAALNLTTYLPGGDYNNSNGSFNLTVSASDGIAPASTQTISFDVTPVVDIGNDTATTLEETPVQIAVLLNDTFEGSPVISGVDGTPLILGTPVSVNHGSVALNANGTVTYTPSAGFHGLETFTYTVTSGSVTETATVTVTVTSVSDAPAGADKTISATEDVPYNFSAADFGFSDPNDAPANSFAAVVLTTLPTTGTMTLNGSAVSSGQVIAVADIPQLAWQAPANANGNALATFTFQVRDDGGVVNGGKDTDASPNTITFNVASVNDLPVAVNDTVAATEDTILNGNLNTNDTLSGDGGNVWAATLANPPSHGAVTVNPDGSFVYTPTANYNGPDSFTYTLTDANGDASTATVNLTVASVNDLPVAANDTLAATEDTILNGTLATNDTPSGDGGNVWAVATPPSHGTVTVNPDGSFIYTPTANYNGPDSFTYTLTDTNGDVSTATVNLTVASVNDLPVAANDTLAATEDTALNGTLATNDTPSGDGGNVWAVATQPAHGTVTVNPDGSFIYTPTANYNGPDSFTYTLTDANGDVSTATVNLTVASVNDLPVAANDTLAATEDTTLNGTLATNDTPSGDGGNVWAAATPPSHGTVTVNPDGSFIYTPTANYNGPDSFTYTLTDNNGDVSTATVNLTVAPVNDLPVAANDTLAATEDTTLNGTLATNDTPSGDGGNVWAVATQPGHGTLTVNPDGSFVYTPTANYNGPDSFTYTLTDANLDVSTATVNLTVASVNDLPVAANDTLAATEDTALNGTLATNDTPSGDGGNVWALANPAGHGTVTVNTDGSFIYTPTVNYNGPDSFTYTLTDTNGDVSTATVNLTVASVNDLPVAVNDTLNATEDTVLNGTLSPNDTPSGDGGNVWAAATQPAHGTVTVNNDGSFIYTPTANYNGPDSFTYTLTDANGDVSTATVNLTVASVNDLPVAANDTLNATEDTVLNGTLNPNDTLSGDGGNVWAVATQPGHGTVTVNPDGSFVYTPTTNYNGPDSFTYTLTDANLDVSTATVNLTVASVNDLPVAANDTLNATEDTILNGTLATNDTPSGDGGNVWAVATQPGHGTVTVNPDGSFIYTPTANYNGPDSFTYTLTDANLDVSTATVNLTVASVNNLPVAANDTLNATEDTVLNGTLNPNDTLSGDGGNVWAVATQPGHGTVTVNTDGSFIYTPTANYNGPDSFTYTLTDNNGDVSTATVNLTVAPVNDLPVAANDTLNATEDTILNGTLATNDTPSGDGGNVWAVATQPGHGTVTVNPDGSFVYTPAANYNGPDSFTYTLTDANGDVSTATVNLAVAAVNKPPLALDNLLAPSAEDTPIRGNLLADDSDPDGDTLRVVSFTIDTNGDGQPETFSPGQTADLPGIGRLVIDANGDFSFVPAANYWGPVPVASYTVSDGQGGLATAKLQIADITPVNDAPQASNDGPVAVRQDQAVSGYLLGNDLDPDGDHLTLVGFSIDTKDAGVKTFAPGESAVVRGVGTLVIDATGNYTFTPLPGYSGPIPSATYTISDAQGVQSTAALIFADVMPEAIPATPSPSPPPPWQPSPSMTSNSPEPAVHVLPSLSETQAESALLGSGAGIQMVDSVLTAELLGGGNQELSAAAGSAANGDALFVQQAVRHQSLMTEADLFVQQAVRSSALESAGRDVLVGSSSNSATPGVSTLFDPFALGALVAPELTITDLPTENVATDPDPEPVSVTPAEPGEARPASALLEEELVPVDASLELIFTNEDAESLPLSGALSFSRQLQQQGAILRPLSPAAPGRNS
jgi:VCBS repeat-containing protein